MYEYVKLKELCTVNQGLQIPISKRKKEPGPDCYFYITVQFLKNNIDNYYIENPPMATICSRDEILMVRTGNTGQVITGVEGCFHNNFFKVKPNEKIIPKYLFYILKSDLMYKRILNAASGTTIPDLKHSSFYELDIPLPTIEIQKKISDILDFIDKKIETNIAINRNLEYQAKSIYKEMILDLSEEEITKGLLSDIAVITMGQSPKGETYNEEGNGTVFYQGRAEFGDRFPNRRLFTTNPKRMASANDVLMSIRAPVGDLNIAYEDCCIGRGLGAIHSKDDHQSFVLYTMYSLREAFDVYNGEGTVFGSINKDAMNKMFVKIPSSKVINRFEDTVSPIDRMIRKNYEENCRLICLRDSLLPKLMSGELDVSELGI